jgi:hypothetical protein
MPTFNDRKSEHNASRTHAVFVRVLGLFSAAKTLSGACYWYGVSRPNCEKRKKKTKNTSVLVGLIPPDKVSIFIVKESSKGGLARGERRILKNCDKGHNEKELGPANRHQFQLHPSNCLFPDTAHNMKMYHNRGMML